MHRITLFRLAASIALACLLLGCRGAKKQAVSVVPEVAQADSNAIPRDPFGSASPAYDELKEVTDGALALPWSGKLDEFAPWLEAETVAIERALRMLKALRVGPHDVYAVANGRIALVYERIALALTHASKEAEAAGQEADWKGQQDRIWEQASSFWARCVRGCTLGGAHLDAWDLRCRGGLANSQAKLGL